MSENLAIEADPFAPGAPDEMVELRALAQVLSLADGFKLIFARCNQPAQQRRLIDALRKELPEISIQEIHLTEPVEHLLDALRGRVHLPAPDAVMVTGLERSLPTSEKALTSTFIANLNASRNSFPATFPFPVVLWLPEYALTAMIRSAPDFFSISSGVYYFAASVDETTGIARSLTGGDERATWNLSLSEKQERIKAIESLLADYEALPHDRRNYEAEARLHNRQGTLLYSIGAYDAAQTHLEQSLKIAEKIGDRDCVASSLDQIGGIDQDRGEYEAALAKYEEALKIAEELGHRAGVAISLHNIGMIHQRREEHEAALAKYEESLKIAEELGHRAGMAASLHNIGMIHQRRGEYEAALAKYEESKKVLEELGDRHDVAISLHQIGRIHEDRGEYEAALANYEKSLRIAEELGDRFGMASTQGQIGQLFAQTGRYPEAFENLLFALSIFAELQSPYVQLAVNELKDLRADWGAENFDAAWLQTKGEAVPDWIKEQSPSPSAPEQPTPAEAERV